MAAIVLSVIGFVIAWLLLVIGSYKGHGAIYLSVAAAVIVVLLSGQSIAEGIMGTYMTSFANLSITVFPLILMGSILGQVYVDSGAASSIAHGLFNRLMKNSSNRARKVVAIALIYIVGVVLCYGGVDNAALMFTLVPLALVFFQIADIPRKYAAGVCMHVSVMCLSGWGAPTFYNIWFASEQGTAATSGTVIGVTALLINIIGGICLASFYVFRDEKKGRGGFEWGRARQPEYNTENMPNPIVALIPLVAAMILFIVVGLHFVVSIGIGIILAIILFRKNFKVKEGSNLNATIGGILGKGASSGATGAVLMCALSGFGAVARTTPVYDGVANAIMRVPLPSVFMYALLIGILCLLTGAAVSGLQAGYGLAVANGNFGLSAVVLHRVGSQAAATFNPTPFAGLTFVVFNLAGLNHKEGYGTILKLPFLVMGVATTVSCVISYFFPLLP